MVHCFGEPPVRSLCCCSFLMYIFICQCPSFCCCIFIWLPGYFTMSPALHPGFSGPWRPPPALSSTPTTVIAFSFSSTASATDLSWRFLPRDVFYPMLLPDIFGTTCFYQGFPGSRQLFLEIFRASYWSSKHRAGPYFCLIHSNP